MIEEDPQRDLGERWDLSERRDLGERWDLGERRDLGEQRDFLLDVVVVVVVVVVEQEGVATIPRTENWGANDSQKAQANVGWGG